MCYRLVFLVIISLNLSACFGTKKNISLPQFPKAETISEVLLYPGDEFDVRFRFWPELDNNLRVRPDGKVSLQFIDDVYVKGMTPQQLDDYLTKAYKKWLKNPEITVITRFLSRERVYIEGAVANKGVISLSGNMTLMDAIIEIGGLHQDAELSNVLLLRHVDGKRYLASFDLTKIFNNIESEPIHLVAQDIIYVPFSKISKLNTWVKQHFTNMIPDIGLSATLPGKSATITILGN